MIQMQDPPHMRRYVLSMAIVALTLAACEAPSGPPNVAVMSSRASSQASPSTGTHDRLVNMMDACDSASFAIGTGDPAGCTRKHGVPFDQFIAELQRTGMAGAWHNAPPEMTVRVGETLVAVNRGGEVHTFTKVARFGGGFVPILNQLSGKSRACAGVPQSAALRAHSPGRRGSRRHDQRAGHHVVRVLHPSVDADGSAREELMRMSGPLRVRRVQSDIDSQPAQRACMLLA